MSWTNYGDVNPIEHGGTFVKHDEVIGGRNYYAIKLTPMEDGTWLVIDGYIDLDDSWIEWESLRSTMDTPIDASDELLACDCVEYYGNHTSNGEEKIISERKEIEKFLENRGIVI